MNDHRCSTIGRQRRQATRMIAVAVAVIIGVVAVTCGIVADSNHPDSLAFLGVMVRTTAAQIFLAGAICTWALFAALWLLSAGIRRSRERGMELRALRAAAGGGGDFEAGQTGPSSVAMGEVAHANPDPNMNPNADPSVNPNLPPNGEMSRDPHWHPNGDPYGSWQNNFDASTAENFVTGRAIEDGWRGSPMSPGDEPWRGSATTPSDEPWRGTAISPSDDEPWRASPTSAGEPWRGSTTSPGDEPFGGPMARDSWESRPGWPASHGLPTAPADWPFTGAEPDLLGFPNSAPGAGFSASAFPGLDPLRPAAFAGSPSSFDQFTSDSVPSASELLGSAHPASDPGEAVPPRPGAVGPALSDGTSPAAGLDGVDPRRARKPIGE